MSTPAVGETLHRLLHAYKRAMREGYSAADLEWSVSHIRVLKGIARQADASAQHIAERMRQDKGRIARLIKDLERDGLVERHPHPDDSRRRQLRLTANGRAITGKIATVEAQAGARMATGLTGTDIHHFIELAETMIANLDRTENRS